MVFSWLIVCRYVRLSLQWGSMGAYLTHQSTRKLFLKRDCKNYGI